MRRLAVTCLALALAWGGSFAATRAGGSAAQDWSVDALRPVDVVFGPHATPGVVHDADSPSTPRATPPIAGPLPGVSAQVASPLPQGTRGWEVIPGVVRTDGVEAFRIELDANGPVIDVTMEGVNFALIPYEPSVVFRDDGLEGDRVAGDFVYTSREFRMSSTAAPTNFWNDPNSPAGIGTTQVGFVNVRELDGSVNTVGVSIGVVRSDIPAVSVQSLGADIAASPHLVNVQTDTRAVQQALRFLPTPVPSIAQRVYGVLPDAFDFLVLLSTNKLEYVQPSMANQTAGLYWGVQVNYTGTGLPPYDTSASFGSAGRLLGIVLLDAYERGLNSVNLTHELTHQWGAYITLVSDGAHYYPHSSVGSLIGGFMWNGNPDGTFTLNCDEGRNGAHHPSPLDLYLMGLIDGADVPDVRFMNGALSIGDKCAGQPVLPIEIERTVSIGDIQAIHGVRTPGPATAKRDFRLGFVVESRNRMLNATEMTFYETLAAHYTRPVPPQDPDPYVGFNWAPVTRFFGHGTTWRSDVRPISPPVITSATANPDVLWPPNGKLVPVSITVAASDDSASGPACRITGVASNEWFQTPGQPDWIVTGPLTVSLRAERLGSGTGRAYTITVTCTSSSGLSASKDVMVRVPHDQRQPRVRTTSASIDR